MLAFILRGLQGCLTGKLPAKRRFDRREFGSKLRFSRKLRVPSTLPVYPLDFVFNVADPAMTWHNGLEEICER
jgi:hypothetical protein